MAQPQTLTEHTAQEKEKIAYNRCLQFYRAEGNTPEEIADLLKDHPGRPSAKQEAQAKAANAAARPVTSAPPTAPAPPQPLTPAAKRKLEAARAAAEAAKGLETKAETELPPPLASLPAAMAGEWEQTPADTVPIVNAE